jgi:hypothetical protein
MTSFIKLAKPFEWGSAANVTEAALRAYDNDQGGRFQDMSDQLYPDFSDRRWLTRQILTILPTLGVPISGSAPELRRVPRCAALESV